MQIRALLAVVTAATMAACSRSAANGSGTSPPKPDAEAASEAGAETRADGTAVADSGGEAEAEAGSRSAATACPEGMVLVDGDFCTRLELACKKDKSWYANWNDKTICEEFESPSRCTGQRLHKRFCVDRYEYPNKSGERPQVMFTFRQAERLCAAAGKRVCTESEWTLACEGPSSKPYPYGYAREPKVCNGDRPYVEPRVVGHDAKGLPFYAFASKDEAVANPELERLWQGVESGSQPGCVSDYGVWDMPGNTDELASSETPEPTSQYDNVTTGGPWLYGVRNQCRPKIYTHNEGFAYYYLSTRCCAEPDGKPTDPRSPKEILRASARAHTPH